MTGKTRRTLLILSFASMLVLLATEVLAQHRPGETAPEAVRGILEAATLAREAGNSEEEVALLERGIESVGANAPAAFPLYNQLVQHYSDLGNAVKAVALAEHMVKVADRPRRQQPPLAKLVSLYSSLHARERARDALDRLNKLQPLLRTDRAWNRDKDLLQAMLAKSTGSYQSTFGDLAAAEAAWNACLRSISAYLRDAPDTDANHEVWLLDCTAGLIDTHLKTGNLVAAGAVAVQQQAALERIAQAARRPGLVARLAAPFGRVAMEQGHIAEARRIFSEAIEKLLASSAGDSSLRVARLRSQLAQIAMLEGHWQDALAIFQERQAALERAGKERGQVGSLPPEYAYTRLRLGQTREAVEMMQRVVAVRRQIFDENSLFTWEGRAFLGVALAADGQRNAALRELNAAIPRMLDLMKGERSLAESGVMRAARLGWLLDGYLGLLADFASGTTTGDAGGAIDEAFRMADLARGSSVQLALAAAASRASISDPALAALARREQDLQREISGLADAIGNLLSRGRVADQDATVADMRASLVKLRQEHAGVQAEIERRFPDYAGLLNPRPVGVAAVQKLLRPSEALISLYALGDRILVWAVPANGTPSFAVVPLTAEQLDHKVRTLRRALDPNAEASGRLPRYDFDLAHELYSLLLKPVQLGWQGARELIVVPHGSLGQLPLGVLTTQPWQAPKSKLPDAEMAGAPWLIKEVAISQLPATSVLPALRGQRPATRAQKAFVGFGDPLFSASTVPTARTARGMERRQLLPSSSTAAAQPSLDAQVDFRRLPQLPDTAQEIEEVAAVLAADRQHDVFLQGRASEALLKKTDLSDYRIVMFATHGLTGGEMPGLYQPALAMANPAITGDGEDGMLTMEEILGLRLHADWVVLSACNTAAAGSRSGESVSGLGRAFFYAGAKSLLVTNWAVETESARLLTTDVFHRQAADPSMTRARALQESSLDLMKKTAGNDYSYAHPMFWAPYSLVGDGN